MIKSHTRTMLVSPMLRLFVSWLTLTTVSLAQVIQRDVVVYGGTPAGIMAAVSAARHGHSVALVDMNAHVGGVVSGGLVATDTGDRKTIGGLSDEFFRRVVDYYSRKFGPASAELKACRNGMTFEPHVAEQIFEQMLAEQPNITVWKSHRYNSTLIDADRSKPGNLITGLRVDDLTRSASVTFAGGIFIDASYEGDLMAGAHVPYRVGRESRQEFGEYLAGVSMGPKELRGLGDHRTMAYNYRVSVTSNTANRVLFPKPEHYDPSPFVPSDGKRIKEGRATGFGSFFTTIDKAHPGAKYDANWGDFPGNSEGYAEGDWPTRERIAARIRDHFMSRLYYFQNDPELPEAFRTEARTWGLPKDEFADNGNWPFQLYVREARRMVGTYVLREHDLTQNRWKSDGIATGSYGIDCHVVQMLRENGRLVPEHTRHVMNNNYDIPYRCLVPPDVANLLVPVCCSATHVAYCSLRMEPVYMMLGQAAGDAAHFALTGKTSVQGVDAAELRDLLRQEGAVLDAGYQPQVTITWTPQHPMPGEKVIFKAISAASNKDELRRIAWDFVGDGSVSAEGARVVHVFDVSKTCSANLLMIDKSGRRRLITADIPVGDATRLDITMDDFDADLFGRWDGALPDYVDGPSLRFSDVYLGPGIHRDVVVKGKAAAARAHFQPTIPRTGRYRLCLGFRPSKSQAANTPVLIKHARGSTRMTIDQRTERTVFNWVPLGEFEFKAGDAGFVEVANGGADGRVVVDGVRWLWLGETN